MTAALILAACADDAATDQSGSRSPAQGVNEADVAFATEMIQHHAGAPAMADMTMGRRLDPQVQVVAEDIRAVRVPRSKP